MGFKIIYHPTIKENDRPLFRAVFLIEYFESKYTII